MNEQNSENMLKIRALYFMYTFLFSPFSMRKICVNKGDLKKIGIEKRFYMEESDVIANRPLLLNIPFLEKKVDDKGTKVYRLYKSGASILVKKADVLPLDKKTPEQLIEFIGEKRKEEIKSLDNLHNDVDSMLTDISILLGLSKHIEWLDFKPDENNETPLVKDKVWQQPHVLLYLECDPCIYNKNIVSQEELKTGVLNPFHQSLAEILTSVGYNPEKEIGTLDSSFAHNYLHIHNGHLVNMSHSNQMFVYVTSLMTLIVTRIDTSEASAIAEKTPELYSNTDSSMLSPQLYIEKSVIPRVIELLGLARLRYHSYLMGNYWMDERIQKLRSMHEDVTRKVEEKKTDVWEVLGKYLEEWLKEKENLLVLLEDPIIHRAGGVTFDAMYNECERVFCFEHLCNMLITKMTQVSRLYDDFMEIVRLMKLKQMRD